MFFIKIIQKKTKQNKTISKERLWLQNRKDPIKEYFDFLNKPINNLKKTLKLIIRIKIIQQNNMFVVFKLIIISQKQNPHQSKNKPPKKTIKFIFNKTRFSININFKPSNTACKNPKMLFLFGPRRFWVKAIKNCS